MAPNSVSLNCLSTTRSCPKITLTGRQDGKEKGETVPGPGKYGAPSVDVKYKKQANVMFGSSVRAMDKKYKGQPGPGAYTPYDPNDPGFTPGSMSTPAFGFGTASRLPTRKPQKSPDPGHYDIRGKLPERMISLGGRRESNKSSSMPGPGQYAGAALDRAWKVSQAEDPSFGFGSGLRPPLAGPDTKMPGPGTYYKDAAVKAFMHENGPSPPNFSLYSRRRPVRADATPGPNVPHFTQFD